MHDITSPLLFNHFFHGENFVMEIKSRALFKKTKTNRASAAMKEECLFSRFSPVKRHQTINQKGEVNKRNIYLLTNAILTQQFISGHLFLGQTKRAIFQTTKQMRIFFRDAYKHLNDHLSGR